MKPKTAELEKVQQQLHNFEDEVKSLNLDRMNQAPIQEVEPQTKLSSREIEKSNDIYLTPTRTISVVDKFNEKFREEYNFAKEQVQFIAEHKEIIGESIEIWTRPFGGVPAQFWTVPVNRPVWGPRYLAEQIRKCTYHKLIMSPSVTSADSRGQYYGGIAVEKTVARLTAEPVSTRKSIFMGRAA